MTALDAQKENVPAHVPPQLVWNRSFAKFMHELDDPYLAGARLHVGPGAIWATDAAFGRPAWILTQHALIQEAYADFEHFSNKRGSLSAGVMDPTWLFIPVEIDPPEHRYYRDVLAPYFTPAVINKLAGSIQQLSDNLISKFIDRGSCEFVSEFASILPNSVVISFLGMPQDMLPQFLEWEKTAICGADNTIRAGAMRAILNYLRNLIADQRSSPRTEFMKGLLSGHLKDRPLNDAEILGICHLLYVAGLDTTTSLLGWIMRYLATDQALQARLRVHPHEIPAAIEEFTRAYGVSAPARTVAKDFSFHGIPMRKGDDVILPTYLAGRDPRAYKNPHVIDIDRGPRHVTFGVGIHLCLGIHLAKREMRILIESFLSRMNNIHIPKGEAVEYHTTGTIGVDRMILAWD